MAGLSDDVLASDFEHERASSYATQETCTTSVPCEEPEVETIEDVYGGSDILMDSDESLIDGKRTESCGSKEFAHQPIPSAVPIPEKTEDESDDVELGGFFLEDAPSSEVLPPEILELQKQEKMRELCSAKNLEKLEGIWKKVMFVIY